MEHVLNRLRNKLHHELIYKPTISLFKKTSFKTLKNKDFSIICSNCLAGLIYQYTGVKYLTPTVGAFFYAPCYVSFIKDLKKNLNSEVREVTVSKYNLANQRRLQLGYFYPIGVLECGIEIHFLHFREFAHALTKWRERSKRVNFENLFFLFSERDLCTFDQVKAFDSFHADRKIIFTSGEYPRIASAVQLKRYSNQIEVGGADEIIADVINSFDLITWLNDW